MKQSLTRGLALAGMLALIGSACGDEVTPPVELDVPTGLAISQTSLTTATVTWDEVIDAEGYALQRASATNPGIFEAVGGALTASTFDDTGLTGNLTYSYRVAAVASTDTSDFSASVTFAIGLQSATINADIAADRTLVADTVYTLSGYIKVQSGATLTIQAGTTIKGDPATLGSSLWILRGANIMAEGTATAPIVFTSGRPEGSRQPGDWGGVIIIGNGIINRTVNPISTEGGAAGESENYAGGNDNNDNSGVLRYVRIEFAGYDVSNGAGQELNSLSMYAVGRGTTIEYVQVLAGLDDGFEWWGGAVDGRYLVSYEAGDDHFDWTEGYQGRNQFLIALQTQRLTPAPNSGVFSADPRGFEGDGCDAAVAGCTLGTTAAATSQPFSMPVFANFTMIGPGNLAGIPADGGAAVWRRGTGGQFFNGILARWKGIGVSVRDAWTDSLLQVRDSLNIVSVLLVQNGGNYDSTANFGQVAKFAADGHKVFSCGGVACNGSNAVVVDTLTGISVNPAGLDWTPDRPDGTPAGFLNPARTGGGTVLAARVASYFGGTWVNTTYLGAADPAGPKWWEGWTAYRIN